MHVEMEDRLPTMRASIDDQTIAAFRNPCLRGELFRHQNHVAHQRRILRFQFVNRADMPVCNDEDVGGSDGMDIAESRDQIIAVEYLGR